MGKTGENLQAAFAGESQANRKYLAFAQQADKDGRPMMARLFRAAADAETVHALGHFRTMGGVKTTLDNLQAAIDGEGFEFRTMYPEFVTCAEQEGAKAALRYFRYALAVEEIHHRLYTEALKTAQAGKDLPTKDVFVCQNCGNTVWGAAPDECPVCGVNKSLFKKVE